jgi:hypothetical protein
MPGIGELIDGAMQQAPQPARQLKGAKDALIAAMIPRRRPLRAADRLCAC